MVFGSLGGILLNLVSVLGFSMYLKSVPGAVLRGRMHPDVLELCIDHTGIAVSTLAP